MKLTHQSCQAYIPVSRSADSNPGRTTSSTDSSQSPETTDECQTSFDRVKAGVLKINKTEMQHKMLNTV